MNSIVASRITISKGNYLKAIAEARSEGETVIAATLVRWLGVSPPAVTMAIKRLKRDSCIRVTKKGRLTLTAKGRGIAGRLLHRHHLIERMLSEIFDMQWYKMHDEAEQLEHAVSAGFERKLVEKLGPGGPCPHGNEVGMDTPQHRRKRGLEPLDEIGAAGEVEVASVFERDRPLLEYLDRLGVRPGARMQVMARNCDEALSLRVDGRPVQLGRPAAGRVWVRRTGRTLPPRSGRHV